MPTYADVGDDASVLAELAQCLQQGEQGSRRETRNEGSRREATPPTSPSVRERKWQSTLGVLRSLEPAAGRKADGGPQRSWPALRARTPAAAGAGGGAHAAYVSACQHTSALRQGADAGSNSCVRRPQTCVGVRARGSSVGVRGADGADGAEHTGAYVGVRPQTCGRAGGGGRSVPSAAAHASSAYSGGAYGSIRQHTSAAGRGRERAFSARERAYHYDSLNDSNDRLFDSSDGGGQEEVEEVVVFWGGRARPPKAVLQEVRGGSYTICVSSYYYMCPHTTIYVSSCYYMCPHTTMYVSSCYYMYPHTTIYVSAYCCMCPHAIIYASSYYSSICVLMLLY
jgi:hypothetical protein